eukprot:363797-Chlamydomonas_euryale.AAC.4
MHAQTRTTVADPTLVQVPQHAQQRRDDDIAAVGLSNGSAVAAWQQARRQSVHQSVGPGWRTNVAGSRLSGAESSELSSAKADKAPILIHAS